MNTFLLIVLAGIALSILGNEFTRTIRGPLQRIGLASVGGLSLGWGLIVAILFFATVMPSATPLFAAAELAVDRDSETDGTNSTPQTVPAEQAPESAPESTTPPAAERNEPDAGPLRGHMDERTELNKSPNTTVLIDYEARPDWVNREPIEVDNEYLVSVYSGPFVQRQDAQKALDRELEKAAADYIDKFLGHNGASRWIKTDARQLRAQLVQSDEIFSERVVSPSFGDMHQVHALVRFDDSFRRQVDDRWHEVVTKGRMVLVGLAGAAVLGMLSMLFGYFRADTATRGYYTGRLQIVTAVAILTLVAASVLLAKSLPWVWL